MKIIQRLLTPNQYSRPCKAIKEHLGIVMHWTANPKATAEQNRQYFESLKAGFSGFASAHFIVGQNGEVLQCVPENEIAYHCGSTQADPASGKVYTDYARAKYGQYAENCKAISPNFCTLGIELCPTDKDGHLTGQTLKAAAELCAYLCKKYKLTADDITTHNAVVGWKDCPRLWVNHPEQFEAFKKLVSDELAKNEGVL